MRIGILEAMDVVVLAKRRRAEGTNHQTCGGDYQGDRDAAQQPLTASHAPMRVSGRDADLLAGPFANSGPGTTVISDPPVNDR